MIIYKATNTITGKSYIGQTTTTLNKRKKRHMYLSHSPDRAGYNTYFMRSIRKYGFDKFIWEEICECNSKKELDEMEFHYIKQYDTFHNGYNLTMGGDGVSGYKQSEEHKRKIGDSNRGEKHGMYGRKHTEKSRKMISDGIKGEKNPFYGKTHSDDFKKKLSEYGRKRKGENNPMYGKFGENHPAAKKWKIIFPDGKTEVIKGLSEFCRTSEKNIGIKLYSSSLINVAKGIRKQHKGFRCEYA